MNPYDHQNNSAYEPLFTTTFTSTDDYQTFHLNFPDEVLQKKLVDNLQASVDYWNQDPWNLETTDVENVKFLLGKQLNDKAFLLRRDNDQIDNRMFSAVRAILSYATGQLAKPEITPSKSDDEFVKMARSIEVALYQHAADEKVDQKFRAAVMNLLVRKRGFLKLRYDPNLGMYGDIVTEVCNPEDITVDRYAKYMSNPNVLYHRIRCSVQDLCDKFPEKESEIKSIYGIKQGRYSQMSKYVTYFEAWFTYYEKRVPKEGVCWFINDPGALILDKQPNPNWVYTGDDKRDKEVNVMSLPPKPFVGFNYLNLGHAYIDETCLFDQGKPQQIMLNNRLKQFNQNVDYMNGRWVASKKAMSEEDATKFINKGAKTIALVNSEDVNKAVAAISPGAMPKEVYQSIVDIRNEIDTMMGTPAQFRGAQPETQDTLGRDLMVKQQAGMLQDDLVRAVQLTYEDYYKILLQMMRVNFTDDYWFQTKGGDGKYDFVMLNGENMDSNVKVGVQVDSTLPLDKASIRQTAMDLAQMDRIDTLTLLEDLGMPDPEIRTERLMKSQTDPIGYMKSVETQQDNNDAEVDIMLLKNDKQPEERDVYDEGYLAYYNHYLTTNAFAKLPPEVKERIVAYLMVVQHLAVESANLQGSMVDDAGMIPTPDAPMMEAPVPGMEGMVPEQAPPPVPVQ